MSININVQVVPFGSIVLHIGSPTAQFETSSPIPANTKHHYQEPIETASSVYEFLYEQQQNTYVVPSFTSNLQIL